MFYYIICIYNNNSIFFLKNYNSININLVNGLILIHPVCIYITYVYLLLSFYLFYRFKDKTNKKTVTLQNINNKTLVFITFALLLGSY